MAFIGEREIEEFEAKDNGDWIIVKFKNGETAEMSGTLFFNVQTENAIPGVTTMSLIGSYFATEWLKDLALNRIELGSLASIFNTFENLIENKKDKALARPFGKKFALQIGLDQVMAMADEAEQEAAALKENERMAAEQKAAEEVAKIPDVTAENCSVENPDCEACQ